MALQIDKLIEGIKNSSSGSSDYLSGINDGAYAFARIFLDNHHTPLEVKNYIEKFFKENSYRGIDSVTPYGGIMVVKFKNNERAEIKATMWQPDEIVLDNVNKEK